MRTIDPYPRVGPPQKETKTEKPDRPTLCSFQGQPYVDLPLSSSIKFAPEHVSESQMQPLIENIQPGVSLGRGSHAQFDYTGESTSHHDAMMERFDSHVMKTTLNIICPPSFGPPSRKGKLVSPKNCSDCAKEAQWFQPMTLIVKRSYMSIYFKSDSVRSRCLIVLDMRCLLGLTSISVACVCDRIT